MTTPSKQEKRVRIPERDADHDIADMLVRERNERIKRKRLKKAIEDSKYEY